MSFIGLELMSLGNPGIFAPVYPIILTALFIIVERYSFPNMVIQVTYTDPELPLPEPEVPAKGEMF